MSIKTVNAYLNFNGDASDAIKLYERALGAKVEHLQRFGEAPSDKIAPELKDRVMHAALRIGDTSFFISDTMPGDPVTSGGNVQVCVQFAELGEMAERFDALAAGGKVRMPLQDMFWGARFGMLTDRFGVYWMFNGELPKK
jgi:PhnB protein